MERDSIEASGSGKNFRSGQTRYHADRPRLTQARGMSVRFVDRLFQRYPPERTQTNTGHFTETARNRRNDALAKSRTHLGGRRTSGDHLAVDANDGVRKNTTRGVRLDGPFARTKPGETLRYRSSDDGNIERNDGVATSLRGILARGRSPTRNTSDSRGNSGRERTGTGHGTERASSTTSDRGQEPMGRTRLQRYANAERR